MGKDSIFSKKICLYREFYSRQLIAYQFSQANIMSIMVWVIIVFMPLIVAFHGGGMSFHFFILSNHISNSRLLGQGRRQRPAAANSVHE